MDVIKRSLELAETIREALQHTQSLMADGRFEQAMIMFEESLTGFAHIEKSVRPVAGNIGNSDIEDKFVKVQKTAKRLVEFFGDRDFPMVKEVLQFTMIPRFKSLQESMEVAFRSYVTS